MIAKLSAHEAGWGLGTGPAPKKAFLDATLLYVWLGMVK